MRLAVIPARGGSKRIPRKNLRPFHARPIIGWSIAAALESGCFDRVVVSTDDPEIAQVARDCGAELPFMRPAELSDDLTPTLPVISHAIRALEAQGWTASSVCCIYATAPLIDVNDLRRGQQLLEEAGCDYVFSTTSYGFPIQRAIRIGKEGEVGMFWPEHFQTRSQDLEPAFHDAGQFYWGRSAAWLAEKPIFSPSARAILLPRWRVVDIDTPEDWEQAELAFEALRRRTGG